MRTWLSHAGRVCRTCSQMHCSCGLGVVLALHAAWATKSDARTRLLPPTGVSVVPGAQTVHLHTSDISGFGRLIWDARIGSRIARPGGGLFMSRVPAATLKSCPIARERRARGGARRGSLRYPRQSRRSRPRLHAAPQRVGRGSDPSGPVPCDRRRPANFWCVPRANVAQNRSFFGTVQANVAGDSWARDDVAARRLRVPRHERRRHREAVPAAGDGQGRHVDRLGNEDAPHDRDREHARPPSHLGTA